MKKISLYLHQDIIDVLRCFGDINDVINKLLEDCIDKNLIRDNIISKARDRKGAKRLDVLIKSDTILQLQLISMSIRPIVYWFVENELYSELDWKILYKYGEDERRKCLKQFDKTLSELNKLNTLCNGKFIEIMHTLKDMRCTYETQ